MRGCAGVLWTRCGGSESKLQGEFLQEFPVDLRPLFFRCPRARLLQSREDIGIGFQLIVLGVFSPLWTHNFEARRRY